MIISRFTHTFRVNDDILALYNSLHLIPVYVNNSEYEYIIDSIKKGLVIENEELYHELKSNKIIIGSKNDDDNILKEARDNLLYPYPTIAYFILSDKCNLACKYCFLGNSNKEIEKAQMPAMSKEIAKQSIIYFLEQNNFHKEFNDLEREFIFYGGEPLINFETLKYIIEITPLLKNEYNITFPINYSMVTNGILLNDERIEFLKKHNVMTSISIDGFNEKANENRVDKNGRPVFNQICKVLENVKKHNWEIGLSITLSEQSLQNIDDIFMLLETYNINAVCFNILYSTRDFHTSNEYYNKVNDFIIEFYKQARNKGIYEDRIMRKITKFIDGKLYLYDCAATAASQIVILPDGRVGICHGCIENKDYFFTDVYNKDSLEENDVMRKWSLISPVNKEYCLSCEALGICGGGCPINAMKLSSTKSLDSIDEAFCIHSKKILEFMIKDLYQAMISGEKNG